MRMNLVFLVSWAICLCPCYSFGAETGGSERPSPGMPWSVPGLDMKFVYVAPGSFQMGSNDGRIDEKPVHRVTVSNGYWLGKYEVTQNEYQAIMDNNPSNFKGGNRPVENVKWNDAVSFCQKLTSRERTAGRLPAGYEYRLPTETEWEFAARGGTASRGYEYSGSDNLDSVAWYQTDTGGETHAVGTKSANELGIYDMSGNVFEWCSDLYGYYTGSNLIDSTAAESTDRVYRGGSWYNGSRGCRVANRGSDSPNHISNYLGFRVALACSSK